MKSKLTRNKIFLFLLKSPIKFPKSFLLGIILIVLWGGYYTLKLPIDTNANSFILESDKDLQVFEEINQDYATQDFLMLAYQPKEDVFAPSSIQTLQNITQDLLQIPQVDGLLSILNAPLLASTPTLELREILEQTPTLLSPITNKDLAKKEILNHPYYTQNIISKDGKTAGILIYLKKDLAFEELLERKKAATTQNQIASINRLITEYRLKKQVQNAQTIAEIKALNEKYSHTLYLSGLTMIANDMIAYVKSDLVLYGSSLTLLLAMMLYFFFRQLRFVLIPLFICITSLILSSGIFAFFDYEITVISSNYVSLLLIITVSLIIHLIAAYLELLEKFPKASKNNLILATLISKATPSFFAIFTTIIGFLSLILSDIEPIIKLGIIMSIGVSVSLIVAFILFAAILSLLSTPKKIIPTPKWHKNFLLGCANYAIKHPKQIYLFCALGIVFTLYGIAHLKVENSFVNYFKNSSAIKQGLLVIDKNLGGTMPLEILVTFPNSNNQETAESDFEEEFNTLGQQSLYWFDSQKLRIAKEVHQYLEKNEFIGSVLSLHSFSELINLLGIKADDFTYSFFYQNATPNLKNQLFSPYINIPKNQMRFTIRTFDSNPNLHRNDFIKMLKNDLTALLQKEQVKVEVNGIMVLYNNLLQNLIASQVDTLSFVIGVIFVVFILIFRSLKLAIIGILTNLIPLGLVFGILGAFKIPLDLMGVTIAAISLGIGVDDVIHYTHRFKQEILTKPLLEAIRASHLSIGGAMYYTTLSITIGFCVMMSSNFIPTIYFGFLTTLVMLFMLAGSLILLPCLIISFYKNQYKK
ncbi:MAG: RND family transporter [Helicobacter sp.]|nr:RND family transporter [Helicobacter sp.]